MSSNIIKMGPKALQLVSTLAQTGKHVISIDDAAQYTESRPRAQQLLSVAVAQGLLIRLERGVYLIVPLEAGPERKWSEASFVIASALAKPAVIAYLSAIRHWNWTEQLPRTVFIQTTQRKSKTKREVLGVTYQFIRVPPRLLFGLKEQRIDSQTFSVTDREKTLLDCADRPDLAGGMATIFQAVGEAVNQIDWQILNNYLERIQRGAAIKRLMYLLERTNIQDPAFQDMADYWRGNLTAGVALLDPALPAKGPIVTRWRLRLNVHGFDRARNNRL